MNMGSEEPMLSLRVSKNTQNQNEVYEVFKAVIQ